MIIQCHEVKRVEGLMYEGCESHWHCVHCNDYWPFHCYKRKDLEKMECPARSGRLYQYGDQDTMMPAT